MIGIDAVFIPNHKTSYSIGFAVTSFNPNGDQIVATVGMIVVRSYSTRRALDIFLILIHRQFVSFNSSIIYLDTIGTHLDTGHKKRYGQGAAQLEQSVDPGSRGGQSCYGMGGSTRRMRAWHGTGLSGRPYNDVSHSPPSPTRKKAAHA